jgi:hypothetical protein
VVLVINKDFLVRHYVLPTVGKVRVVCDEAIYLDSWRLIVMYAVARATLLVVFVYRHDC